MNDVFIIGAGQTPVAEHWGLGLRELGASAIRKAMADAGVETVDALFVGNMLGGAVNGQENLGALLADAADSCLANAGSGRRWRRASRKTRRLLTNRPCLGSVYEESHSKRTSTRQQLDCAKTL